MSNVSVMPVSSEQGGAMCANCGAALVADQRYCLACGQPCSPVRLAFLDVLQEQPPRTAAGSSGWPAANTIELVPSGYMPADERGPNGWLRRNSGLLGLLAILLMCLLVGLLVGHWASQSSAKIPAKQVVEIKGLPTGVAAAAAPAAATGGASTATETAAGKSAEKEEAKESKEAAKETKVEKAPPPAPVKVTPAKLKKLTKTTGKQHQEEINALGAQPIETG